MTKPLKIMHVTSNLGGGGVERLLVKSLAYFDHSDFEHQVCCLSGGVYEDELRTLGIPYRVMKRRSRFNLSIVAQMASLMRQERVDVVHTLNFTANAWGRAAAKLAGVPRIIAHERGTAWTETPIMRLLDRLLYRITDLVLANSNAAQIILTHRVRLPGERIRVVYNGLPPSPKRVNGAQSLRTQIGINSHARLVGTVGRLDTPKGHTFMLEAIPLVWAQVPETHFVLIGDGPLRETLQTQADHLGLTNSGKFHILGFTPQAPSLLGEMDLLIHPSIRESLGNVLIEAGLSGLPAIASNVDGIPEVIIHNETGLLVDCTQPVTHVKAPGASPLPALVVDGPTRQLRPPRGPNPVDLARSIVFLLLNPSERMLMGKRARAHTQEHFSIDRYVRDLENVYRGG